MNSTWLTVSALTAAALLVAGCSSAASGPPVSTSASSGLPAPASSSAATVTASPSPTEATFTEPSADWANAALPTPCSGEGLTTFHNGASRTSADGDTIESSVGKPAIGDFGKVVYAIVPTFCTGGAIVLAMVTLYRVASDGSAWERVRELASPDEATAGMYDTFGFEDGQAYVDWLGYSRPTSPRSSPDMLVSTYYSLTGDAPGEVVSTSQYGGAPPNPTRITVTKLFTVPNLIGLDRHGVWRATALSPLSFFGMAPAGVTVNETIANMDTCPVTWQSYRPGSLVKRGTQVRLKYC